MSPGSRSDFRSPPKSPCQGTIADLGQKKAVPGHTGRGCSSGAGPRSILYLQTGWIFDGFWDGFLMVFGTHLCKDFGCHSISVCHICPIFSLPCLSLFPLSSLYNNNRCERSKLNKIGIFPKRKNPASGVPFSCIYIYIYIYIYM